MRKYIILLGATLVGGVLFAQPRVIGVHPAHDGKLLTMEDAVVGRNTSPQNRMFSWVLTMTKPCDIHGPKKSHRNEYSFFSKPTDSL